MLPSAPNEVVSIASEEDRKSIRDRAMLVKRQETASAVAQMRQRLRAMGVLQKVDAKEETRALPVAANSDGRLVPNKPSSPQEHASIPPPPPPTDTTPPSYIEKEEEIKSNNGEADDSLIVAAVCLYCLF